MNFLFYGSFFLTCLLLFRLVYLHVLEGKAQIKGRLTIVSGMGDTSLKEVAEEEKPFRERVIEPLYKKLLTHLERIAPSAIKQNYNILLDTSGMRGKLTYSNLLMIQIMLALLSVLLYYYFAPVAHQSQRLFYMGALGAMGLLFPYLIIRQKAFARKELIQNALPGFLDLIYVSVEAGLSFDMAIHRTMDKLKGPLSEEFGRTMEEIRHGRGRAQALRALAARVQLEDVQSFITAIIQAEELGSNIGNVLRVQSQTIRQLKKQRLEEKAAKIPTKMTFPLVLLMFPSLFIVILGPAVINIMENLM